MSMDKESHKVHRHSHKHDHKHDHKHGHKRAREFDLRDLFARYFFGFCIVALVAALGLGTFIGWGVYQAHLYQVTYRPEIEAELGFTTDSPWVKAGGAKVEVFTIHPVHDGYMDKIGFRDGDIITSHSLTKFYKMLYTQRERTVSVSVVDGGDGLPIKERKVRTLRFLDPPKR